MSNWPNANVVRAAILGRVREVFKSEAGETWAGARSSAPWIFLAHFQDGPSVVCERCAIRETLPDPPANQGAAVGARTPLFTVGTKLYALYVLSKVLHPFFRLHEACAKPEPAPTPAAVAAQPEAA